MKQISTYLLMSVLALVIASCSVSRNTVGGGSLQKRKYTRGFYVNKNHGFRTAQDETIATTEVQDEQSVVSGETVPAAETKIRTEAPQTAGGYDPIAQQDQSKNQKQDEQKSPAKKKAGSKTPKPVTPTRPRREREHEYFIPAKEKTAPIVRQQSGSVNDDNAMFILAVIFAILIPPIGVLIYTSIDWTKVLICLLLTILFFIPGMIYALLVVFDVI